MRVFIVWIEEKLETLLEPYCKAMFPADAKVEESDHEEFSELLKFEKQTFLDGKYSTMFQKILGEMAKTERYQIGSKKEIYLSTLEY